MANTGDKFLYFLIGGFVGASVALLFAPRSGEETRRFLEDRYKAGSDEVSRRVQVGREFVAEAGQGISETITETLEKGREVVNRQKEQLSTAIEAGKKAYQEEKGKLESGAEEKG